VALFTIVQQTTNKINIMGNFKIDITLGQTLATSSVKATGILERPLTDDDMKTLGFYTDKVGVAIGQIYGHEPTNVYYSYPGGGGHDLYKKYNWEPVTVVCTPGTPTLTLHDAEDNINVGTTIINDFDYKITGTSKVDNTFSITLGNSWSHESTLAISQEIDYGVSLEGVGNFGGKTTFNYSDTVGTGKSVSTTQTVNVGSSVEIPVPPHTSARAELHVGSKKVIVTVPFTCYLKGTIACNYKHQKHLNGIEGQHHFFHFPVVKVLNHAGITNNFTNVSTFTGGYYTDTTIKVLNVESGEELHMQASKSQ
jgi:hypothetical protein